MPRPRLTTFQCRLLDTPEEILEEGLASTARMLVSKLDDDDVSATVAAQLLLGAAMPLCRFYIQRRAFQRASALLLHATPFAPFLPQRTASALLRLAHNSFEQERSAGGPAIEYDCRILAAALETTCAVPIASGTLAGSLTQFLALPEHSQKASEAGTLPASANTEHKRSLQRTSGQVMPCPAAADRAYRGERPYGGAEMRACDARPVTPTRRDAFDRSRGSPCALLCRCVGRPRDLHVTLAHADVAYVRWNACVCCM